MTDKAAAAVAAGTLAMLTIAAASVTSPSTSGPVATPRDPIPYYIVEELPAGTLIGSVPVDAMLDRRYERRQLALLRYASYHS